MGVSADRHCFVRQRFYGATLGAHPLSRVQEKSEIAIPKSKTRIEKVLEISLRNRESKFPKIVDYIFEASGCPKCNNIGYRGRTTVSEVLSMTKEMEELITKQPTTSEVEELAIAQGMITMPQDGILESS